MNKLYYRLKCVWANLFKKQERVFSVPASARFRKNIDIDFGAKGRLVMGENSEIRSNSVIECHGTVTIGERSVVGAFNWFQGSGKLTLGKDVIIGPHCSIISSEHGYEEKDIPFVKQPFALGDVVIGDNVWIGSHVVILNGVTIGDNVVIGAHSLVNKDIESNSVVVGSPIKTLKKIWGAV